MTKKTVQKGLQPLRIIRKISVEDDSFTNFLSWLTSVYNFSTKEIIDVVDSPYNYEEKWEEYHATE